MDLFAESIWEDLINCQSAIAKYKKVPMTPTHAKEHIASFTDMVLSSFEIDLEQSEQQLLARNMSSIVDIKIEDKDSDEQLERFICL